MIVVLACSLVFLVLVRVFTGLGRRFSWWASGVWGALDGKRWHCSYCQRKAESTGKDYREVFHAFHDQP